MSEAISCFYISFFKSFFTIEILSLQRSTMSPKITNEKIQKRLKEGVLQKLIKECFWLNVVNDLS